MVKFLEGFGFTLGMIDIRISKRLMGRREGWKKNEIFKVVLCF